MATEKQIAANRKNAQHGTGPKSAAGKAKSARNALKHGMTAQQIVLPNENPEEFQSRLAEWNNYFQPENPAKAAVIERAVSSKWKLDRISRVETERLSEKVRHAVDQFDLDRFTEAETLGRRLVFEPCNRCEPPQAHDPIFQARIQKRIDDNPAILFRQMQMTMQGRRLADRALEGTGRTARLPWLLALHREVQGHLDARQAARGHFGRRGGLENLPGLQHALHPECCDRMKDHPARPGPEQVRSLGRVHAGEARPGRQADVLPPDQRFATQPAEGGTGRRSAHLWDIIRIEILRLRALKAEYLDELNERDRAGPSTARCSTAVKRPCLLRRYETACEREFHKAIADIDRMEKNDRAAGLDERRRGRITKRTHFRSRCGRRRCGKRGTGQPDARAAFDPRIG